MVLLHLNFFGQKKVLRAITSGDITIDAKFNEPIWEFAPIATDFVMFSPDNGKPISKEKKTEVQIVYNDDGIFIAAKMFDDEPNKILKEITQRDNFGTSENFAIFLNGFNDSQQDFRFFVSAAGVQADCVFTNQNGEDYTWDAIWESTVRITDYGWVVEMKIPYAALRFSTKKKQTWGVNFYREIRRDRQSYTWNFIDSSINNESAQSGLLEGIDDIETPTRLFFIPYSSFYLNSNTSQKTQGEYKGGLDIKYGISDAFTLDAILVPDFGQTKFDNVILNLSPFEQQFTENRPFFTESTDLFQKGNLFYSRRIGETFLEDFEYESTLNTNEQLNEYPKSINLLNAIKISGRTKGGLGIGVLNAITERTTVSIKDIDTDQTKRVLLEPLANYNVLVLDQRFKQNSSVSFVNTNVTRNGQFRDANVSALVWDLNTKKNTYNLSGDFKYSSINNFGKTDDKAGINSSINIAETSGNYRYGIGGKFISKDFDSNDLGILFQTHFHSLFGNATYQILNPNKTFNTFTAKLNLYSEFENKTGRLQTGTIKLSFDTTNHKNNYLGYNFTVSPVKTFDFYEPRSFDDSKFLLIPESIRLSSTYSTNANSKLAVEFNPQVTFLNEKDRINTGVYINPRYRFNDHFSLSYEFEFFKQKNNIGSAQDYDDLSVFTKRNITSYNNTLQGKYALNHTMTFNLSVRHYWAYAKNKQFLTLLDDGSVVDNLIYNKNIDSNFNTWNLDLSYSWWFAPGSQISVLYRNFNLSTFTQGTDFSKELSRNFSDAIKNNNLDHIFSISIRYFIDYNSLKN
ncbi:DUF5916 domain-containing protein [Flavobacterium luteum]|uniref:Carbohydrate binding family 9 domain-containing protein n=1 Tax=Flavobacterium luteum TaxID=2026654 RepID=A0A7J5AFE3_9FLAO|nr:DUF5916 domain-containing protein [Flavobacterium luteum]KAB1156275.1 carbohydrate binding family 9 domain-containing protein [Flavobacterium luteum]